MFVKLSSLLAFSLASTAGASSISCDAVHPATQQTFGIPSWHSQNYSCLGSPLVYAIHDSPGKGLGVFASRPLVPGDIIMRERPVIAIHPPPIRQGVGYPLREIGSRVRAAFETLSESEQDDILSLTAHTSPAELGRLDPLIPIFRSNAYNTGDKIGLFPKIARINHSCRPNLSYFWNERIQRRVVYATRPISEGEELFVSYIPLMHSKAERQKRLDQYGFKCSCEACSAGKHQQTSDARRQKINRLMSDLLPRLTLDEPITVAANKSAYRMIDESRQLIDLVEEEHLADHYAQAYRIFAVSLARLHNWHDATKWAHKSYQLMLMADEQSAETKEMATLTRRFIANWDNEVKQSKNET